MSILFLVGEEFEEPEIVKELLDIEKFPSRPQYDYASPENLFLWNCQYDDIQFDAHAKEKTISKILVYFK